MVEEEYAGARGCPMSRRRFLQGLGAGVAATAVSVGGRPGLAFGAEAPHGGFQPTFGRMFPKLPPFGVERL